MGRLDARKVKQVFESWLVESGYGENTVKVKLVYAKEFFDYVSGKADDMRDVGESAIRDFIAHIDKKKSEKTGKMYAARTKMSLYGVVKLVFRCLYVNELIVANPTRDIEYRPQGAKTVREILTIGEMSLFLDSIPVETKRDIVRRAVFELMYSSGLRVSEVEKLAADDIDFESRMLLIRQAKWKKDRVVPVSDVAMRFLALHLEGKPDKGGRVFSLKGAWINRLFKRMLKERGMYRRGCPLIRSGIALRHTFWRTGRTSGTFRSFSATSRSRPPACILTNCTRT
jgi:site-specific recombinase XerD